MSFGKLGITAATVVLLGAAGCQSDRFSSAGSAPVAPAPLPAAPAGNVTSSQLPPPAAPTPPATPETQVAAVDPAAGANAPAVTEGGVAGVWNVSVAGQSCRVATPRTKFGQGYRAAPLRCPAPLDGVRSWAVQGNQVVFYDENGGSLASLASAGAETFNGTTSTGAPVSLTR